MKQNAWHAIIGILLITGFFSTVALVVYVLYGPGPHVVVPDVIRNFGFETSTTTKEVGDGETSMSAQEREESEVVVVSPKPVLGAKDVLADAQGTLFQCAGGKALKAEFTDERVRLALSDGRIVTLPQTVSEKGEIFYANADESFVFRNIEDIVFLEEGGITTYKNCAAE